MAFQFIHTGDWHLAKSFGRFDPEKAPLLRAARAGIVDRVGELARRTGCEVVLVAGDVFDGPLISDSVLRRLAGRLEQFPDICWHFLPGNHDPAVANGVWERFARFAQAENVVIHHEAGLYSIEGNVDLLTAPLHARAIAHDPTAWMDERPSADGVIRIGLAHGAVQGFGSAAEASVLILPERALSAGLDYLALGDWHGVRQVGPKAWYAGTPEPDQFPDNEPGYVLRVRIAGPGAEPEIERHWLGQYCWKRQTLSGDLLAGLAEIERSVAQDEIGRESSGGGVGVLNTLMRLHLSGRVSLSEEVALRNRIERLGDLIFHTEADFSRLRIEAGELAPDALGDPLLASVGARLADTMAAGGEEGKIAHQALLVLTNLAEAHGETA